MRWWLNHILLRLEKKGLFSSGMSGRTKAAPPSPRGSGPGKIRISGSPYLAGLNGLGDA